MPIAKVYLAIACSLVILGGVVGVVLASGDESNDAREPAGPRATVVHWLEAVKRGDAEGACVDLTPRARHGFVSYEPLELPPYQRRQTCDEFIDAASRTPDTQRLSALRVGKIVRGSRYRCPDEAAGKLGTGVRYLLHGKVVGVQHMCRIRAGVWQISGLLSSRSVPL